MLKGYKVSVILVKQFVAAAIAAVMFALAKHLQPDMVKAIEPLVTDIVWLIVTVVFGVDAAGLAMQNADN